MSSLTNRVKLAIALPAAFLVALGLSSLASAQMHIGDVMTPGGFSAGTESKDDVARDQKAANNWNNGGNPQHELTVSQGGKLPDSQMSGGGSGGGGQGSSHPSPVTSGRIYNQYPSGYYNMGSNRNAAVGMGDGAQTYRAATTAGKSGSGGGGGEFVPANLGGRGGIYGGYGGSHYSNYGAAAQSPQLISSAVGKPAGEAGPTGNTDSSLPACCKAHLPCCNAKWPCCPGDSQGIQPKQSGSSSSTSSDSQIIPPVGSLSDKLKSNHNSDGGGGGCADCANSHSVTTPPETEPLLGPPQTYSGLSAPMAANMKDMLRQSGLDGPPGGKMLGAAQAGILGMAGAFQQIKAANMPGSNSEQAKVNQNAEKGQTADNLAGMEREQAATAIDFVRSYLENFTTNGGNKWNRLRDNLFVPMAILLLLPGAVLAQVKSIVSQGFSVLGDINPFEGILRAIIGVFLIPATYLMMNYGIDVANSFTKTIAEQYHTVFGTDMYEDAFSGHVRAFPVRLPEENYSVIPNIDATMYNYFGDSPLARLEGRLLAIKYHDPAVGLYIVPADRAAETVPFLVNEARLMYNQINAGLAFAWTILCAVQQCYLYYLWFVGPVVAALWIYPMNQLRQAFPNWIEGVVSLCFWSFFWSTTILLMACFRGVDDTGTIIFTALNFLALGSVKFAFDFSGLVKDAGREAARLAEKAAQMAGTKGGGGGKPEPNPNPGPGPSPGPGPNPNPNIGPDKIDPVAVAQSNTSDITSTPIALSSSPGSFIEGNATKVKDSTLPPISALGASGPLTNPSVQHPEPPLSQGDQGIQVAAINNLSDLRSDLTGFNSRDFAADYPTQAWQQVGSDASQTKAVNGPQIDQTLQQSQQDAASRDNQDRSYQEQREKDERQEQERRQQQTWVNAELQAAQQQQQQEHVRQQAQKEQQERAQAMLQEQPGYQSSRELAQSRRELLSQPGDPGLLTQGRSGNTDGTWQGQQASRDGSLLSAGNADPPPSSQRLAHSTTGSPLSDGQPGHSGQAGSGSSGLPGLAGSDSALSTGAGQDPLQTASLGQGVLNQPGANGSQSSNLPTAESGAANPALAGQFGGKGDQFGPPLTGGYPSASSAVAANGDYPPALGVDNRQHVVSSPSQTDGAANNYAGNTAQSVNPASIVNGQPAGGVSNPQQPLDPNNANAFAQGLPQNVLAPGSSPDLKQVPDAGQAQNQIVQVDSSTGNDGSAPGLKTLGQVVNQNPDANGRTPSSKLPFDFTDLV